MLSGQKRTIRGHFYDCRFIYLAFWISAAIFLTVSSARGLWPFGAKTILKVDLYHQYAPFLVELRSRVLSHKSLLYSWETGLGKNFPAQTAYYAASPLNILIFLFPENRIPEVVYFLILLKICLCSSSFTYYLRERFGQNDLSILIFGLMYGFCAFNTCYYWNVMWLDTVALFPLTALGCERLIREKKVSLYYASLTLTMIVNFYLAVLVCILITLYAAVTALTPARSIPFRETVRAAARFVIVSLLCAMTAMFILGPVAYTLRETRAGSLVLPDLNIYPNIWQLIPAHFPGARDIVLAKNSNHPNLYSGLFTLILLPLYFGCPAISRKEKILHSSLLVFMLLCACFGPLDYLIHGFHFPACLPHRFTFIYSFLLLRMSYQGGLFFFKKKIISGASAQPKGTKALYAVYGTAVFYIIVILFYESILVNAVKEIDHVLSLTDILVNLLLTAIYSALITFLPGKEKFRRLVLPLLLLLVCGECVFSFYENLNGSGRDRLEYVSWMEDTKKAVAYTEKEEGGEFFRTEYRRFLTVNEGSLYHYRGFSQFSSLAPGGICDLMQALGSSATGNSFRYYDTSPLVDSLFSIRYVLSRENIPSRDLAYKYTFMDKTGRVNICKNDRVLPLGFMTEKNILNWKTADSQPFEVQNDFLRCAVGTEQKLYTVIDPDQVRPSNLELDHTNEKGNVFSYHLADPYDFSVIPSVHAQFLSDRNQYLTLYVDAWNARRIICSSNRIKEDRELSAGRGMIDIGLVSKGEMISIDFELTRRSEYDLTYPASGDVRIFAASWNDRVFQEAFEKLSRETLQISSFSDTEIHGTVDASRDGILLTSIPFTKGWKASVDGKAVEKIGVAADALLGISISEGHHEIVLKYNSPFFRFSLICSLSGLILFLIFRKLIRAEQEE